MIVLFDEVELLDVAGVMQVASVAGRRWNWRPFRLVTAALEPGLIDTRNQVRIEASASLSDCPEPELVLVPGGYGARRLAQEPSVIRWLQEVAPNVTALCAIGAGVAVLGAAGLLRGERVAASAATQAWLGPELPQTVLDASEPLVTSGKILSAAASTSSVELGLRLVERTLGKSIARGVRNELGLPGGSDRIELEHPLPAPLRSKG